MTGIQELIVEAEKLVAETRRMVEKGWERKSRLIDAEEYLAGLKLVKQNGKC